MIHEEMKAKAKYYNEKYVWDLSELQESGEFQRRIRFTEISDLEYEVMNFFYDGMLGRILRDAHERSERYGFGKGYEWGKRYLDHYAGWGCLVSKAEHPALHSREAYDLLIDLLSEECWAGDDERQARLGKPPRNSTME